MNDLDTTVQTVEDPLLDWGLRREASCWRLRGPPTSLDDFLRLAHAVASHPEVEVIRSYRVFVFPQEIVNDWRGFLTYQERALQQREHDPRQAERWAQEAGRYYGQCMAVLASLSNEPLNLPTALNLALASERPVRDAFLRGCKLAMGVSYRNERPIRLGVRKDRTYLLAIMHYIDLLNLAFFLNGLSILIDTGSARRLGRQVSVGPRLPLWLLPLLLLAAILPLRCRLRTGLQRWLSRIRSGPTDPSQPTNPRCPWTD